MILTRTYTVFVYVCDDCGKAAEGQPNAAIAAPQDHAPASRDSSWGGMPQALSWTLTDGRVRCGWCAEQHRRKTTWTHVPPPSDDDPEPTA